jgi:hypothetical protein
MHLDELKDSHAGQTAYVLGSGTTVEFYDPEFFADKLLVATNNSWSNWLPRVDYMVTKYHELAQEYCKSDRVGTVLVSRGHTGQLSKPITDSPHYVVFEHEQNRVENFTAEDFPDTGLVVSFSTITSSMHFAAHLGARHIVMVGSDCGWIDTRASVTGHPSSLFRLDVPKHFDFQNRIVADQLRKRYGCSVSSMLPFVTPNMEGHKYVSPFGRLNDS